MLPTLSLSDILLLAVLALLFSLIPLFFFFLYRFRNRPSQNRESPRNDEENELSFLKSEIARQEKQIQQLNLAYDDALLYIQDLKTNLIFNQKMSQIGKLFAGIAHELNNPISAIKASTDTVIETITHEIQNIAKAKEILVSIEESEIEQLIETVLKNKNFSAVSSYTERREQKKKLKTILESHNLDPSEEDLEKILDTGLIEPNDGDLSLLYHKNTALKNYILSVRNLNQHLSIIQIATDRAASILLALKKFSKSSTREISEVKFKLCENIETVLTIYQYQMRGKVSLTKTITCDALLLGFPEELYQVWTNLILNALQAMKFNGNIMIYTKVLNENWVEVRIRDNGPGIPIDLQKKIFDADFTTKNLGEGSGLGLQISKSIIEKHRGTISVISDPGKTEFIIQLPVLEFC